jgi:peptidoglycan/LPS O-acetylase OafA/YrhL
MAATTAREGARTFASVFDPRANSLNFVRLMLAVSVIVWHSFPLSGNDIAWAPLRQFVGEVGVDGFFAISGYLIVASWMRDPHAGRYLRARALRILPAFWVCLLFVAFVLAPFVARVFGMENLTYVAFNAGLYIVQEGIAGTPLGVPFPGAWNGSLWTLWWEFCCYLGVMVLGLTGLLRRRGVIPLLFVLALAAAIATSVGVIENAYVVFGARFGLMFLAGAMVFVYRDRVPVSLPVVAVAVGLLVGALFLPNYRLLAALPLAYLVLVTGALLRSPRLRLRNDISYGVYIYAFPVQQVLAIWGFTALGVPIYAALAIAATLPLAAASWFLVEKPAMRLKGKRPQVAPAQPSAAF